MAFGAFGVMFSVAFGVITAAIIAVIVVIIFRSIRGISTWNKNNHSPQLTVPVLLVSKRMEVSGHSHGNAGDASGVNGYHTTSSTWYYATFQFASGDRMEFKVDGSEYGMLAEGDEGSLTFQGTRYLGFERRMPQDRMAL